MGTFTTTAYGPPWNAMEGTGITSKGVKLKAGQQKLVVAVDPTVIPYGTKLKIWPNPFGDRNLVFTAADTGGAFQGGVRKIDFFIASGRKAQNNWGVRKAQVKVVGRGSPKDVSILGQGTNKMHGVKAVKGHAGTPSSEGISAAQTAQINKLGVLQNYLQQQDPNNPLLQIVSQRLGVAQEAAQSAAAGPSVQRSASPSASAASRGPGRSRRASASAQGLSPLKELFYDPQGGWKNQQSIGAIGGHSDHVHVAAGPKTIVRLGKRAQQMGLSVGENSHFNGGHRVTSGHVANSNHYRDEAIDVSGSPKKMSAFAHYIRRLYGL